MIYLRVETQKQQIIKIREEINEIETNKDDIYSQKKLVLKRQKQKLALRLKNWLLNKIEKLLTKIIKREKAKIKSDLKREPLQCILIKFRISLSLT